MHIHHPDIAKEFDEATTNGKRLPYKVKKKKRPKGIGGTEVGAEKGD